jgi:uncharacterized RDD family membrane protein YckC
MSTATEERDGLWQGQVLAGFWTRVWASLLDGVLVGGVAILVHAILTGHAFAGAHAGNGAQLGLIGIGVVVALAYYVPQMVKWNGRTIGKRALRIRVVREVGGPMTLSVAVVREILCKTLAFGLSIVDIFVSGVALLGTVDYLWVLGDGQNRAVHDMVARTRVVHDVR